MEQMLLDAVWATVGAGLLLVAVLLLLIAGGKTLVLLVSAWVASDAARTPEYVDQWVSVAKIGGIGVALGGLFGFIEFQLSQQATTGSAANAGVLMAGIGLHVLVPEAVRLRRHYKDARNKETPDQTQTEQV